MSDRINSFVVVLERDLRDDDAVLIADAIRQLRGVASVTGNVSDIGTHVAYTRARQELEQRLWAALKLED